MSETAVQSRLGHTFADPRSQDATWTKSSICHHTVTTLHSYSLPNMPMRKEKKWGYTRRREIHTVGCPPGTPFFPKGESVRFSSFAYGALSHVGRTADHQ